MHKQCLARFALSLLFGIACFFVALRFCNGIGYSFFVALLGPSALHLMGSPLLVFPLCALPSALAAVNLFQLLGRQLPVWLLYTDVALYLIATLTCIMLKSRGIQGFNLNLADIAAQWAASPFSVIFNGVALIPLGCILRTKLGSSLTAFGLAFAIVVALELTQYVLHLGICDVVDVVLNMAGFTAGYLLATLTRRLGIRLVRTGQTYRIERG